MKNVNKKPKAIIYCRVATEDQLSRSSLEKQKSICLEKLKKDGKYELLRVVEDSVYFEDDRDMGLSFPSVLLLVVYKKISAIYVTDFDRISRNTTKLLKTMDVLARHDVKVISVSAPDAVDSFTQGISIGLNLWRKRESEKMDLAHRKQKLQTTNKK